MIYGKIKMLKVVYIVLFVVIFTYSSFARSELIKKSKSGICHDTYSSYYVMTKNFTSYNTLQGCINSGGRLPKNHKGTAPKLTNSNKSTQNNTYSSLPKYSRNQFGSGWADLNRDCQNSRMEALISQSIGKIQYKSSKKCKVKAGKWISTFTGKTIYRASKIDIDHVVPLSWAWKHGAYKWPRNKRVQFANDPSNLLSVEASLNRQKGDKGIGNWLPPKNKCQYISRFLRVYKKYNLSLTSSELSYYATTKVQHCNN
jgi:hypothetical protein